jgi:long-chain fatty acid transport protein
MTIRHRPFRRLATGIVTSATVALLLGAAPVGAGGLSLFEVGTADVGLASAGYTARAQDASTVFTNPAGMTRLDGTQLSLGAQLLYADGVSRPAREPPPRSATAAEAIRSVHSRAAGCS